MNESVDLDLSYMHGHTMNNNCERYWCGHSEADSFYSYRRG